jgi:hypothetical protein
VKSPVSSWRAPVAPDAGYARELRFIDLPAFASGSLSLRERARARG